MTTLSPALTTQTLQNTNVTENTAVFRAGTNLGRAAGTRGRSALVKRDLDGFELCRDRNVDSRPHLCEDKSFLGHAIVHEINVSTRDSRAVGA